MLTDNSYIIVNNDNKIKLQSKQYDVRKLNHIIFGKKHYKLGDDYMYDNN